MNVTLFGKRVFPDVIKDLEKRSFWIRIGPKSMTSILKEKKRREDTEEKST